MNEHIVTTDDDPAIRKIMKILLTKAGFQVSVCSNGEELLSLLASTLQPVHAVILDLKMPGRSGFELLPEIKEHYHTIPVIMLTAFNDLETGMKAMRMGAADFLSKPVRQQDLISCVKRVLEKAQKDNAKAQAFSINNDYQKKLETQLNSAYTTIMHTTMATIEAFSETIEQKDVYTKGHCSRVRSISLAMSNALHLSQSDAVILEGGALLHDVGKIGIPESILNKNGKLSDEEFEVIKQHPEAGERIVKHMDLFKPYVAIIRNHHERFDGRGYPDGLKGEEIPLLVRIVTIADAFDAMTSSRPYRAALSKEIAAEELKMFAGTQFDPDLVNMFIEHDIYLM